MNVLDRDIVPARSDHLVTGRDVRMACRRGEWSGPTSGLAPGFAQANLVIVPRDFADDFRLFCERNPRPCPLLEMTPPGDPTPRMLAHDADLRTDLPQYRVWIDGRLSDEPRDISGLWRDDFVAFLIGCSFTFDAALLREGLSVRHVEQGCNVPMYGTRIPTHEVGRFRGPLVVSMRPLPAADVPRAVEVTAKFPHFHGPPVHAGDPQEIGIADLSRPDYGESVAVREGEVPVFWACGVTPQSALVEARLPLAITHAPGHMFVTDRTDAELLSL